MRNALSYVVKTQQSMVAAALRQAFTQPDRVQASQTLRRVADQLRQKWPKLAWFMDESETDVLSHLDVLEQHRAKIHSTNPLERLNKEVKRRLKWWGVPALKWSSFIGRACSGYAPDWGVWQRRSV
jgi:putative transposase